MGILKSYKKTRPKNLPNTADQGRAQHLHLDPYKWGHLILTWLWSLPTCYLPQGVHQGINRQIPTIPKALAQLSLHYWHGLLDHHLSAHSFVLECSPFVPIHAFRSSLALCLYGLHGSPPPFCSSIQLWGLAQWHNDAVTTPDPFSTLSGFFLLPVRHIWNSFKSVAASLTLTFCCHYVIYVYTCT